LQGYTTPVIHFQIATWLQSCSSLGKRRLLLTAFRASGKSTIIALYCAWVLHKDPDLRILVLSAETSLSSKMVRNIKGIIEKHPLTRNLIPKNPEQWGSDRFTVDRKKELRDPSVISKGITSNITGIRADIIICDDVEVPNTCDTATKREDLRERLSENEYILVPNGTQIYVGTPHSYYSIYAKTPRHEIGEEEIFLNNYERIEIPILDKDGNSAWPERYPATEIEKMKLRTGPNKFTSQMMLKPVNITEGRLNPELLKYYDEEIEYTEAQQKPVLKVKGRKLTSCSAWWDPSFASDKGDNSVLAIVFTDEDGEYWLHRLFYLKTDDTSEHDEATQQCKQVAKIAKEFYVPSISLEINGIGKFLPSILKREMAVEKSLTAVIEKSSTRPKGLRIIEGFDAIMAARSLNVHKSVTKTPFISEMQEWQPGKSGAKDDGLDAVAGALSSEPVRIKHSWISGTYQNWQGYSGNHQATIDFDV
jgi:hypothetical protein